MRRFEFDEKLIESYRVSTLLVQGVYIDDDTLRKANFDVNLVRANEKIRDSMIGLFEES